jgi:hypothetical protein
MVSSFSGLHQGVVSTLAGKAGDSIGVSFSRHPSRKVVSASEHFGEHPDRVSCLACTGSGGISGPCVGSEGVELHAESSTSTISSSSASAGSVTLKLGVTRYLRLCLDTPNRFPAVCLRLRSGGFRDFGRDALGADLPLVVDEPPERTKDKGGAHCAKANA